MSAGRQTGGVGAGMSHEGARRCASNICGLRVLMCSLCTRVRSASSEQGPDQGPVGTMSHSAPLTDTSGPVSLA
eukprot:5588060-Prymnesium_polylepis.1